MKFLEGKTPAERNKTIAAAVLGFLAIVTLGYTFLFSGSSKKTTTASNSNKSGTPQAQSSPTTQTVKVESPDDARNKDLFPTELTPIPENPFPPLFGDAPSRNIFAFYEPPPAPAKPVQVALPSPIPSPTPPPILVQYVNPQTVYAKQGDFTMELAGDKFTPDTRVLFNGMEVPTQFVNAQRLTAQVSAALIAGEGPRQIMARAGNGDISNVMMFNVQAPPTPNYNFVGLVARKRFNNDTAMLQDKANPKQYQNVRLGETIGRFKVVSISSKEVVLQDTQLNFRHNLAFVDEKSAGRAGAAQGRRNEDVNNGFPQGFDPNVNIQYQQIPGIPNQYVQPQPMPQPIQPMPQQTATPVSEEEDSDGDNF